MFKYLILLVALTVSFAHAAKDAGVKTEKSVVCYPIKPFLKELRDKYGEEPMLFGEEISMNDVGTAVYVNKDNGTYTVFEFDREAACVLSVGTNVRYRFPKTSLGGV